jgi:hypothetical protein
MALEEILKNFSSDNTGAVVRILDGLFSLAPA